MKAIFGFGFFLLFLAGIALVMLQGQEMARQNLPGGGASITGMQWRPVTIGSTAVADDSSMFVRFAVDGSIDGNGGCNKFFGSLQTTDDGISVGELGSTRMACPQEIMDQEMAFMQALQDVASFELGENSLHLLSADSVLLVDLAKASNN